MRRTISNATWAEICTAYASGIGLREIARNMNIPEGTVLARAKREGWTRQIESSKALAKREGASPTVTPVEAVAITMQQRGERHLDRMANIVEKLCRHVEAMEPAQSSTPLMKSKSSTRLHAARLVFSMGDSLGKQRYVVNIALLGVDPEVCASISGTCSAATWLGLGCNQLQSIDAIRGALSVPDGGNDCDCCAGEREFKKGRLEGVRIARR